jgi:hypothetical protein
MSKTRIGSTGLVRNLPPAPALAGGMQEILDFPFWAHRDVMHES